MAPDDLRNIPREELVDLLIDMDGRFKATNQELARAQQQLDWLKKQLFGRKSERRIELECDPKQLALGEVLPPKSEEAVSTTPVKGHARRNTARQEDDGESGLRFDPSVPVERIVIPNPELEGVDDKDQILITERITHQLAQQPASYKIIETVRQVIKRRDNGEITCPKASPSVLEKSYADVSLLAGMLIDKFRYHLPLYRQHQRMKAAGITVSRASLTNWVHRASSLLAPIYLAQRDSVLESTILAMDETPIKAGRKAKGKMRQAYFWPIYGDRNEVVFPYADSRAHSHVEKFLGNEYEGTLLTDGYGAYEAYAERREKVTHAACWAHARRGFIKAEGVEPGLSAKALDFIGSLYEIEAGIKKKGLEAEAKLAMRGEKSRPIAAELFEWLDGELRANALLPSNPFTDAASYVLKRRAELEVFLANPEVPIDTNHLERSLRPIPLGRKNWMFCWTELGAEHVGRVQSLITTCVLQEVDPYIYLVDVLQRIAAHPQSRVAELTPRLWKEHFAENPLRSAIDPRPG
ncbi:MAG: IS66 family transposase [Candidatus Hydrogenedentes bacterium]|nr:IS66 family transposase [Candidatus Hydrogenedentota bacterium]